MINQDIIERENDSGSVSWTDSLIVWQAPGGGCTTVDLNEVAVIGEYTTDVGPYFDDWFLVFITRTGEWSRISIYADGIEELKRYLSQLFHADFSGYHLTGSTVWQSYITYPFEIAGSPVFTLTPPKGYKTPDTFFRKLQAAMGLGVYGKSWDAEYSNEVVSRLYAN